MRRHRSGVTSKCPRSSNRIASERPMASSSDLNRLTISEAAERLRRREISAVELTSACLDRIAAVEPRLNAFITVTADEALVQARTADKRLAEGDAPAMCGIPLAIKDIYCT